MLITRREGAHVIGRGATEEGGGAELVRQVDLVTEAAPPAQLVHRDYAAGASVASAGCAQYTVERQLLLLMRRRRRALCAEVVGSKGSEGGGRLEEGVILAYVAAQHPHAGTHAGGGGIRGCQLLGVGWRRRARL